MKTPDPVRLVREQAWLGDAVLSLFAREYLLRTTRTMDPTEFTALTSNTFLSALGPPTTIEAHIGQIYQTQGLPAAYHHIQTTLLPLYLKQKRNRR